MNPRIEKIRDEIEKIKIKLNKGQTRLRELEKQLTDLENADIVAAVRGVEIAPDELAAFVRLMREKQGGSIVPDLGDNLADTLANTGLTPETKDDKEDSISEN